MSEQENTKIARQFLENLNKHNNEGNRSMMADNMRTDATGEQQPLNRDKSLMYHKQFSDAFPDLHFDVKDIVAQGDLVIISWVATGTHTQPLNTPGGSISPTNKKINVPGFFLSEIRDNKITRQTITWDQLAFLLQLGVMKERDLMAAMSGH
jgi:steroid delta-isomerase-like uncharacterized protein